MLDFNSTSSSLSFDGSNNNNINNLLLGGFPTHTTSRIFPNKELEEPHNQNPYAVHTDLPLSHHIIPYNWTFWFHSRQRPKAQTQKQQNNEVLGNPTNGNPANGNHLGSYLSTTHQISFPIPSTSLLDFNQVSLSPNTSSVVGSVESVLQALSLLKRTEDLNTGSEYLVFKAGVQPVWEDKINEIGGRWVFRFSRKLSPTGQFQSSATGNLRLLSAQQIELSKRRVSLIWEKIVLQILGGGVDDETFNNEVVGLVISIRRDEDILSIWNTNLTDKKIGNGHTVVDVKENGNNNKNNESNKQTEDLSKIYSIITQMIQEADTQIQEQESSSLDSSVTGSPLALLQQLDISSKGGSQNKEDIDKLFTDEFNDIPGVIAEYRFHSDSYKDGPQGGQSQQNGNKNGYNNNNNNNNNNNINNNNNNRYNNRYNNHNNHSHTHSHGRQSIAINTDLENRPGDLKQSPHYFTRRNNGHTRNQNSSPINSPILSDLAGSFNSPTTPTHYSHKSRQGHRSSLSQNSESSSSPFAALGRRRRTGNESIVGGQPGFVTRRSGLGRPGSGNSPAMATESNDDGA